MKHTETLAYAIMKPNGKLYSYDPAFGPRLFRARGDALWFCRRDLGLLRTAQSSGSASRPIWDRWRRAGSEPVAQAQPG